ncbi:unnamed protein product [Calicophoron daubneyi]|uniref:Protein Wnt n=1 Tax=Calicophoron daubneyi TaxID=300641 RepID=A0AAV2T8A9_CALDB
MIKAAIRTQRPRGIYRLPRSADHPADSTAERFTPVECQKANEELGFRQRQLRFCNHPRFGYAMLAVLRAAHAVGYHCPKAFADRRWNCTSIHRLPEVSPELRRGTREQALVHAFASAALLFEIGRYCALNKIRFCSCGDETAAYPMSEYAAEAAMPGQNPYADPGGALVYEATRNSGGAGSHRLGSPVSPGSNTIPMTDGQPTVSRFYWAGCSDNLRVAREYASAFLGFPNIHVMLPPPLESSKVNEKSLDETNLERFVRATSTSPLHEKDDLDECEENDVEEYNSRIRRDMNYPWQYQNHLSNPRIPHMYNLPSRAYPYRPPIHYNRPTIFPEGGRWGRRPRSRQRERKPSILRALNRHNYLAGVVLMEANQKLVCKCHGVSGSCAQRVCFRQLRRIDNEIMQKALKMQYLAAKQVTVGANRQLIAKTFTGSGFVDEVVRPEELVFSEHSPDYCSVEPQRGSVGTHGRLCTLKDAGTANCVNMCCGRGYRNVTTQEVVQCNCRMGEGFKVKCDECTVEVVTHVCL